MPKIQFKRGLKSTIPTFDIGEPGFTTDTEEIFIGSVGGNIQLAKQSDITDMISVNAELDGKVNITDQQTFNITTTPVSYFTTLDLPQGLIMQGAFFSQGGKYILATVANGATPESFTIYRCNNTGKFLDSMTLTNFGHGTTLGIEDVGTDTYIWANCGSDTTANDNTLTRFKYVSGATYLKTDPNVTVYSNFGSGELAYPTIDGQYIYFCRYASTNVYVIERRLLSDVKAGINSIINSFSIPTDYHLLQGICMDGDTIYWLSGDSNGTNYPIKLTSFNIISGLIIADLPLNFGQLTDGVFYSNYKEPEGVFLYKDADGSKSLFVGMVTGTSVSYRNNLYAYHSVNNFFRFQGMKMQDIFYNPDPVWITLPLLNGATVGWGYPPQYRYVSGNRVQFRGNVIPSATGTVIGTVPYQYKPRKVVKRACAGDGSLNVARVGIDSGTGNITIDLGTSVTSAWLEFEYSLDN